MFYWLLTMLCEPILQPSVVQAVICFLRVSIGILTLFHGIPKMTGGVEEWRQLGTFVHPLGIYFWPIVWGFLGASTEFFGGMLLALGLTTRLVSFALIIMMIIATVWHIDRGDSFNQWSFPLSLIFVYATFLILSGGRYSVDYYLTLGR